MSNSLRNIAAVVNYPHASAKGAALRWAGIALSVASALGFVAIIGYATLPGGWRNSDTWLVPAFIGDVTLYVIAWICDFIQRHVVDSRVKRSEVR